MWEEIKYTLQLGWPIILGNLTQIALGIIDSAMVGAIHSSQLAAAAFVNNVLGLPTILGIGLTMAISPLVAAALGEGDTDKPLIILYNGLWLAGGVALLMALTLHFGVNIVFHLGQDAVVAELAGPYLRWMGWAMAPMILFLAMKQYADGLELTRWPMYLSLSVIPINVLVNYAFIYGYWGAPRMELEGAGVGTLLSRTLVLAAMAALLLRGKAFAPYRQHLQDQLRFRADRLRDLIRIGLPSSLQYGMESSAFAVSGIMVGWLGYQQQAAHQIAISLAALAFMVSLGISTTGSIRVARAYGQKNWAHARRIGGATIILAAAYGLLCAIAFVLGRHQLPLFFNDEPAVLIFASSLLVLAAGFQISDSVQAVAVGLLRGIQDVRIPTLFVAFAYWIVGIPAGYALAFWLEWEITGIWWGFIIGLSVSAILLSLRFLRLTQRQTGPRVLS